MGLPNQERKLIADTAEILPVLAPAPLKKAATLSNLWGSYVASKGQISWNYQEQLRLLAKRFLGFFREKELCPETLLAWCKFLRSTGIAVQQISKHNAHVRAFLKFLKKLGFIKHDLWEFVELPKLPDPKMPEIVTEEEYQRLKALLVDSEKQWLLWLFILGYRTGMSLCDCCHLRWEQVFLNHDGESYMDVPRIKLRHLGEKAVCRIPVIPGSDLHEWILKLAASRATNYKRADGLDYVHQEAVGYYDYNFHIVSTSASNVFRKAGIKSKTFASFRRTFISNLVNSGMDYALVMKVTGHTNIKTLLRYLRPDRKALQDGVMKAQQYAETRTQL